MTEFDVPKEAKPSFYLTHILPLLLRNRVVLFEGFGNRLAFDPVPFDIQVLSFADGVHQLYLGRDCGFHICVFSLYRCILNHIKKRCLKRHVCRFFQRLRCRCNFHALRFLPNLQDLGLLIAQRMRENHPRWGPINDDFNFNENSHLAGIFPIKYSVHGCDSRIFP